MEPFGKLPFNDLKPHIAEAIKESCYKTETRLYNIANEVPNIQTFSVEPGVEIVLDLVRIIDKTIEDSVAVGCDLSVITKGLLLGAFRASPFVRAESHKTIRLLIDKILQSTYKHKGDVEQVIVGIIAAIMTVSVEFKFYTREALVSAREDILICAQSIDPKFNADIKEILSKLDVS